MDGWMKQILDTGSDVVTALDVYFSPGLHDSCYIGWLVCYVATEESLRNCNINVPQNQFPAADKNQMTQNHMDSRDNSHDGM